MKMNYYVVGTNDMEAAATFYDALFEGTEVTQLRPSDRMIYWLGADFAFAVARPFDGEPATRGNGTMVGFDVGSDTEVARFHARAIALGGTCAGEPSQKGPRFSGYIRDLDGNKICLSD
jgi:catechol 2,3-dioxygenase-like lactoylglutathione lyase family enzyme